MVRPKPTDKYFHYFALVLNSIKNYPKRAYMRNANAFNPISPSYLILLLWKIGAKSENAETQQSRALHRTKGSRIRAGKGR